MKVHNPHTNLLAERGANVKDWSRERTRRRLATLARLASPYRWRVILGVVTLLLATAADHDDRDALARLVADQGPFDVELT